MVGMTEIMTWVKMKAMAAHSKPSLCCLQPASFGGGRSGGGSVDVDGATIASTAGDYGCCGRRNCYLEVDTSSVAYRSCEAHFYEMHSLLSGACNLLRGSLKKPLP